MRSVFEKYEARIEELEGEVPDRATLAHLQRPGAGRRGLGRRLRRLTTLANFRPDCKRMPLVSRLWLSKFPIPRQTRAYLGSVQSGRSPLTVRYSCAPQTQAILRKPRPRGDRWPSHVLSFCQMTMKRDEAGLRKCHTDHT